jgi:hypothetical protein
MAAVQSTKNERLGHAESRLPRARGSEESASAEASEAPEGSEGEAAAMHEPSHVRLVMPVPHYQPGSPRLSLGGIVVPTARPVGTGSGLAIASEFATAKDAQLIVIRSGDAMLRPFPEYLVPATTPPMAVIDLPPGAERIFSWRSDAQAVASLYRDSDLGFKRNLGLVISRMCGYDALLFLDDDISNTPASQLAARSLDSRKRTGITDALRRLDDVLADFAAYGSVHASGYFQRDMHDNSVFCHVRRLLGRPQETFISGGALAVRCRGPVPLFSKAYNEDWIFFLHLMIEGLHSFPFGGVRYVGTVHQDSYYPFSVLRAQSEELGDLFAEGLFWLLGSRPTRQQLFTTASSPEFWEQVIDQRCQLIDDNLADLCRLGRGVRSGLTVDARKAMQAARAIYTDSPFDVADALAAFFVAVTEDRQKWRELLNSVTPQSPADTLTLTDALNLLDLDKHVTFLGGGTHGRWAS